MDTPTLPRRRRQVAPRLLKLPRRGLGKAYIDVNAVLKKTRTRESGLVYDRHGRLVIESRRPVGRQRALVKRMPAEHMQQAELLAGRHFYMGVMSFHFGHFICETLPMLSYMNHLRQGQLLFHPLNQTVSLEAHLRRPWVSKMLGWAGVDPARIQLVTQPMQVGWLVIPQRLAAQTGEADPRVVAFLERMAGMAIDELGPQPPRHRGVYLSRSKLVGKRGVENEPEIEQWFREQGFVVVHPEKLSLSEQIGLVRNADWVAGLDGSALHMSLFMKPGSRLIVLGAREGGVLMVAAVNAVKQVQTYVWPLSAHLQELPTVVTAGPAPRHRRLQMNAVRDTLSRYWEQTLNPSPSAPRIPMRPHGRQWPESIPVTLVAE